MSKKNKVSSSKKGNKKVVKKSTAKKSVSKKAAKSKATPKSKLKGKKFAPGKGAKLPRAKVTKGAKNKSNQNIISSKKSFNGSKSHVDKKVSAVKNNIADKPHYKGNYQSILSKKNSGTIPEYKPTIEPTKKSVLKSKDSFAGSVKQGAQSSIISSAIKKTDSYSVKAEKEPPGKFELEFVMRTSPELLYEFLTSPSGLSEWFCDDVNIRNGIYTFIWDGQLQQARLLKTVEEQLVRYQWVDKTDGSYFEFKIQRDELTNDISLIITDFAGDKGEAESAKLLWASQVEKLMQVLGSFF